MSIAISPRHSSISRRRLVYELVGQHERVRRAGVGPVTFKDAIAEAALFEVVTVDVGDLQFAAAAGLQRLDESENVRRIDVDAGDGAVALGFGRLFFDVDDS